MPTAPRRRIASRYQWPLTERSSKGLRGAPGFSAASRHQSTCVLPDPRGLIPANEAAQFGTFTPSVEWFGKPVPPDLRVSGAGDGNRTYVRTWKSAKSTLIRLPILTANPSKRAPKKGVLRPIAPKFCFNMAHG